MQILENGTLAWIDANNEIYQAKNSNGSIEVLDCGQYEVGSISLREQFSTFEQSHALLSNALSGFNLAKRHRSQIRKIESESRRRSRKFENAVSARLQNSAKKAKHQRAGKLHVGSNMPTKENEK
jgi:hypothetical protein